MSDDQARRAHPSAGTLVLLALLTAAVVLWPLSGWDPWPWIWGVATTIAVGATLAAIGVRERVGRAWIPAAGLTVMLWQLETTPAAWGIAAGVVLTLAGLAAVTGHVTVPQRARQAALILGPTMLVTAATVYTIDVVQQHQQRQRAWQEGHDYALARTLPRPRAAVDLLVEAIGFQHKIDRACFLFTDRAERQFAAAHNTDSCAAAIAQLGGQVRNRNQYVNYNSLPSGSERYRPNGVTLVDACHLEFGSILTGHYTNAGPQIGRLTFVQQYEQGSYITNYRPCR